MEAPGTLTTDGAISGSHTTQGYQYLNLRDSSGESYLGSKEPEQEQKSAGKLGETERIIHRWEKLCDSKVFDREALSQHTSKSGYAFISLYQATSYTEGIAGEITSDSAAESVTSSEQEKTLWLAAQSFMILEHLLLHRISRQRKGRVWGAWGLAGGVRGRR